MSVKIGEIIEARTDQFIAESYELHNSPPFGSLVKTTDGVLDIYAIVYNAGTGSIEPGRRPVARGKQETDEDDIYRNNPQLCKLLRTEFSGLVVGYRDGDAVYHYLAPRPAHVHGFVYQCTNKELLEFTSVLDFLSILVNATTTYSSDELVAACLRQAAQAYDDKYTFMVKAGKILAHLLCNEPQRLDTVLRRMRL